LQLFASLLSSTNLTNQKNVAVQSLPFSYSGIKDILSSVPTDMI